MHQQTSSIGTIKTKKLKQILNYVFKFQINLILTPKEFFPKIVVDHSNNVSENLF